MAARKARSTKATSRRAPSESEEGRLSLILEDMRDQFRVFGEGLLGVQQSLTSFREEVRQRFEAVDVRFLQIEARLDRMDARIGLVESALLHTSGEIRELRMAIGELRAELAGKADRSELNRLEARIAELERRVGLQ